jgi:hypothetical protein
MSGKTLNTRTVWLFDIEKLREVVASERTLRGSTYVDMERETGVNWTQIATFVSGKGGLGVHGLVSMAMWANLDVRSLVKKQRQVATRQISEQEKQLRILAKYLTAAGLPVQNGESPVDAAIRLLATARDQGADFEADEDEVSAAE